MTASSNALIDILTAADGRLLDAWLRDMQAGSDPGGFGSAMEWEERARELLTLLSEQAAHGSIDLEAESASRLRYFLDQLSRELAQQGLTTAQTATFVFSLKKPLFQRVREACGQDAEALATQTWAANELIDRLGLYTATSFQRSREDVIRRQQEEMLELSTPVVKLWDGVLALPMIGTLDSARTQQVMETLLERIVETGSEIAIIDITGVPTVDTLVAQHLLKTVTAIRLMGADCIISGIRPQIAQTIVHLGIDLQGILTKASLADALSLALARTGHTVSRARG
jgi:rsbT co-antagonist protein RsbR